MQDQITGRTNENLPSPVKTPLAFRLAHMLEIPHLTV